jgi:predicted porin
MKRLGKRFGLALVGSLSLLSHAHAADVLPTTKPAPTPATPNCFASWWDYVNSTAADCPLSWGPFTVYATLDAGFGYQTNGANWNPAYANGVANGISKQSYGVKWQQVPNGLNQSVIGIKLSQPIEYGWSLVGTLEAGFDPYSLWLANGQRSQVQNNGKALLQQNANSDSTRSGQWDNSQGFLGVSNPTYGTLVAGRVNSLALDGLIAYDPMGSAYAFSPFGFSGQYAGFGDTEIGRSNTALKYRLNFMNFRVGALAQVGGYNQGNGSTQLWQSQLGGDFDLFGGKLSLDGIGNYAQNAVSTSTFTGTCSVIKSGPAKGQTSCVSGIPMFYNIDDLKATLSNNTGVWLLGKYKLPQIPLTIAGGWGWWRQANPSDDYLNGFKTLGGWSVPGTIPSTFPNAAKLWPTQWVTSNAYNDNRIYNMFFIGGKYAINDQIDVAAAYYYGEQNNYNSSTTPCASVNTTFIGPNGQNFVVTRVNNSACAGSTDFLSFLIDYRPVKRVDLYAGVMLSNVYAGLANGYPAVQTIAPTAGLRVKF